ncbi:MAG: hypothetical protein FWD50_01485 [Betaproteobacteria bacterium]|nr:hypothetical protein [Betaproteobacteria bacterium]
MDHSLINPAIEKSFSLRFLKSNAEIEHDLDKWLWQPARYRDNPNLQTATFSGKNQADDYTNE